MKIEDMPVIKIIDGKVVTNEEVCEYIKNKFKKGSNK